MALIKKLVIIHNKISDHIPIPIGFSLNGNFELNFGLGCIKNYVKHLLEIETKHSVKLNKTKILKKKINYIMVPNTLVISVVKHV